MKDSLPAYLHDHLAGARFAIHLLESLRDQHPNAPVSAFAADLLAEIAEDRNVLQGIAARAGDGAPVLKEAAAWVGEKLSRLKLNLDGGEEFGTFEALEALAAGIQGKLCLWRALKIVAEMDPRVRGVDYTGLCRRAEAQHARVEERRLETARAAFIRPAAPG